MATKKPLYSLTDEHRAQLKPWAEQYISIALRTEPQTEEDRDACRVAMRGLYQAASLEPPRNEVFCPSPISAAIAGSIAAGVWYLREHPEQHGKLFGRNLSEPDILAARDEAIQIAIGRKKEAPQRLASVATSDAIRAATRDATSAATADATEAATEAATRDATSVAIYDAIYAATADATRAETDAATYSATYSATRDATDDAIYAATADATRAETDAATYSAIYAATTDATADATRAATEAATRDATEAATEAATRDAISQVARFLVGCCKYWYHLRGGGNQWSGWTAYLSFFDRVAGLELPTYANWRHFEAMTIHGGPRFMHKRFWIVSDFPTTIGRDDRNRPHCVDGPQLAWRDGHETFYIHGVRVDRRVVMEPNTITVDDIDREQNAEVRRVMIERFGSDRYMREAGGRVVDRDPSPEIGTLWRLDIGGDEALCLLEVKNSTPEGVWKDGVLHPEIRDGVPYHKVYWLRVPHTVTTAREANAWTWGLTVEQYTPVAQT